MKNKLKIIILIIVFFCVLAAGIKLYSKNQAAKNDIDIKTEKIVSASKSANKPDVQSQKTLSSNTVNKVPNEPDSIFFKLSSFKKEYLPKARTQELITLPNNMAVMRYITYDESLIPKSRLNSGTMGKLRKEGKKIVYEKFVLRNKKTKKEKLISISIGTEQNCLTIIPDAIIKNDLSQLRWIVCREKTAYLENIDLKDPNFNIQNNVVELFSRTDDNSHYQLKFLTPDVISVQNDMLSIQYYLRAKKVADKQIDGSTRVSLVSFLDWRNECCDNSVFNRLTHMDGRSMLNTKPGGSIPKYDMNEWKGWTRMNFDKKTLTNIK